MSQTTNRIRATQSRSFAAATPTPPRSRMRSRRISTSAMAAAFPRIRTRNRPWIVYYLEVVSLGLRTQSSPDDAGRPPRAAGAFLEIAHRIHRDAVHTNLEVEVRAEAMARTADVADHLALGDILAAGDGDLRLVGVRGGQAVVVVDRDEVAVPLHPTAVHDRTGGGGVNRSAGGGADVDPGVQAAPAHAERARDRSLHGPDQPRRGRRDVGRAGRRRRRRRADLRRERVALGLQVLGFCEELLLVLLDRREALPLYAARGRQLLLRRDQSLRDGVLLLGSRANGCGLNCRLMLGRARPLARRLHLGSSMVELDRDLLVLSLDPMHVFDLVEQVAH